MKKYLILLFIILYFSKVNAVEESEEILFEDLGFEKWNIEALEQSIGRCEQWLELNCKKTKDEKLCLELQECQERISKEESDIAAGKKKIKEISLKIMELKSKETSSKGFELTLDEVKKRIAKNNYPKCKKDEDRQFRVDPIYISDDPCVIVYDMDGLVYEGEFWENTFNGYGILYLNKAPWLYGEFHREDLIYGTMIFEKYKYTGSFFRMNTEVQFNGYGKLTQHDKGLDIASYKGQFKDNKPHGIGKQIYRSGGYVIGQFKNGLIHGQGAYYYPDGKVYVGEFKNGKMTGEAVFFDKQGNIELSGLFKDGKQIKNYVVSIENNQFYTKQSPSNKKIVNQETTITTPKNITEQVVSTTSNLDKESLKEELAYWKELFEDELITQAEYDAKRKELLSGASVTTTTTVVEPKVEKKKVVAQTTVVENNTTTIDLSFKDKNYINRSLLDKMGFFSNDGKIKDYCEDKYPKLHVYMECYAQNVKKYRNYKRAAEVYDLYIDYGRYLAWEAMIGNISESSARYQLSAKRKELGDAYEAENRDKWNRIADSMEQLRKTHESLQPKPIGNNKVIIKQNNTTIKKEFKGYKLVNEYVSGKNKICEYKNYSGSGYAETLNNKMARCPMWSQN